MTDIERIRAAIVTAEPTAIFSDDPRWEAGPEAEPVERAVVIQFSTRRYPRTHGMVCVWEPVSESRRIEDSIAIAMVDYGQFIAEDGPAKTIEHEPEPRSVTRWQETRRRIATVPPIQEQAE